MTTTANGRQPRKQLSDQLDRMDGILDLLADGLPQAVADACREGARQAVKDAVLELLANPDLRAALSGLARPTPLPALVEQPPPKPSLWARLKEKVAAISRRVAAGLGELAAAVRTETRSLAPAVSAAGRGLALAWRCRLPLLVALGVGLAVAVLSYLAPHAVSAAVSGVGGMFTAVGVAGGLWVRRTFRAFGLLAPDR